jgi:hypothetical protein
MEQSIGMPAGAWHITTSEFDRDGRRPGGPTVSNDHRRRACSPGCYLFFDSDCCLYVGSSMGRVSLRVLAHIRGYGYADGPKSHNEQLNRHIERAASEGRELDIWVVETTAEEAPILEGHLVYVFRPLYNQQTALLYRRGTKAQWGSLDTARDTLAQRVLELTAASYREYSSAVDSAIAETKRCCDQPMRCRAFRQGPLYVSLAVCQLCSRWFEF